MTRSASRPRATAAITPIGIPSDTPMSVATVASSSVAGKNRRMSARTGLEVRTDRPKSPASTFLT